ncbi:hypoxanthine phosphoribosyltransferase [Leptospira sp. GIMC2001]|uniref:hypoxanthine phosphoribosyltransferase n=1 Tax=Leptospira sp. GIMC2001 TaxID=1513297 RepID=UPI002349C760|nr:hypoxanthine phosphoribosyltransferase [Leptospira sp. GIMC2001]WCL50334.1 hypoxanthine phosphoribosyltransferase [Leptospira sp. GIMC2001]
MIRIDPLISESKIQERVKELGLQISEEYSGKELMLCGVLNGAFIFLADLTRNISIPHVIDFMGASSYGNSQVSSGKVQITKYLSISPKGKHVLVVEDIVETANTYAKIHEYLQEEGAKSVKICSLVVKNSKEKPGFPADYKGFEVEDQFLVGYGMDFAGQYRQLPFLGIMKQSESKDN